MDHALQCGGDGGVFFFSKINHVQSVPGVTRIERLTVFRAEPTVFPH